MTASTIARVITDEIVARFGAPTSLHSDQGRNVDSALMHKVCSLLGTKKTRTTAYHPASDGLVERLNQTLEQMLSYVVSTDHRDWDVRLPSVMMAYRSAVQSSTGYTPHYLLFGREMRLRRTLCLVCCPPPLRHPHLLQRGVFVSVSSRLMMLSVSGWLQFTATRRLCLTVLPCPSASPLVTTCGSLFRRWPLASHQSSSVRGKVLLWSTLDSAMSSTASPGYSTRSGLWSRM